MKMRAGTDTPGTQRHRAKRTDCGNYDGTDQRKRSSLVMNQGMARQSTERRRNGNSGLSNH
ncbi:hypothetical protein MN210_18565 [Psychrobacter raelei]|uniref:Uncharacterized protein n=1 Tax=Psychrobacter raelei TaxID=2565531 RepID=A0AAU6PTI4_9GAMM